MAVSRRAASSVSSLLYERSRSDPYSISMRGAWVDGVAWRRRLDWGRRKQAASMLPLGSADSDTLALREVPQDGLW